MKNAQHRGIRTIALGVALLLGLPETPNAHEVPQRVAIFAYVKPAGHQLRLVIRVPLESMRDMQFRVRADSTLDLSHLGTLLPEAAEIWIANYLELFENGKQLPAPKVSATQLSLPSDRSFESYEAALRHVSAPPLSADTDLRWQQAMFDMVLEYPIASDQSRFSIKPALAHLGVRTSTVLRFLPSGGGERAYQYFGDPGLVDLDPRWHQAARRFVALGFEHILGGLDHLLFIFCLVIPIRRWRALVAIVTAFTAAHSITLIGSAYGFAPDALWFPPLVETLIAVSIVYMALENMLAKPSQLSRRWMLAFGFGLVHGFGFSFALKESLQFAGTQLLVSLAAFNVGVEMGQLLVLALALPVLAFIVRHSSSERTVVVVLSALVAHSGWHWMTDRLAVVRSYRFAWPSFDSVMLLGLLRGALLLSIAGAVAWLLSGVLGRMAASTPKAPETGKADA